MKISLRGLLKSKGLRNDERQTLNRLQLQNRMQASSRAGILEDAKAQKEVLETSQIPNPTMVEERIIHYWPKRSEN